MENCTGLTLCHWLHRGMLEKNISYSDDQAQAYDTISEILRSAGVDISNGMLEPHREGKTSIAAVIGKAGSGLMAPLYVALRSRSH